METKELTEEQKEKFKKLRRSVFLKMMYLNFKFFVTLFLANLVIAVINAAYVQNKGFGFVCTMISCFMILRSFLASTKKEHDRVTEEAKKILES